MLSTPPSSAYKAILMQQRKATTARAVAEAPVLVQWPEIDIDNENDNDSGNDNDGEKDNDSDDNKDAENNRDGEKDDVSEADTPAFGQVSQRMPANPPLLVRVPVRS